MSSDLIYYLTAIVGQTSSEKEILSSDMCNQIASHVLTLAFVEMVCVRYSCHTIALMPTYMLIS